MEKKNEKMNPHRAPNFQPRFHSFWISYNSGRLLYLKKMAPQIVHLIFNLIFTPSGYVITQGGFFIKKKLAPQNVHLIFNLIFTPSG